MGQEQSKNGVTVRVEDLITDRKQPDIFKYADTGKYGQWNGAVFLSRGSSYTYQDPDSGKYLGGGASGEFFEAVPLSADQGPEVWLKPNFTRMMDFSIPVRALIRQIETPKEPLREGSRGKGTP